MGLREGDHIVMHAQLSSIGMVDGGAAMVLHRLLSIIGKKGTLLMPTFTRITRHTSTHDAFTKAGCWCEGKESRHLPFIPELQPDREIGEIAYRLCSWPASRRSRHPAFSMAAVGNLSDMLVRNYWLRDPFMPFRTLLKEEPLVLTIGVGLDSVSAIHLAEQRYLPAKFINERALTVDSSGPVWVDVVAPGCSLGFSSLAKHINPKEIHQTDIGSAKVVTYPMRELCAAAERVLKDNPLSLSCERPECLSCSAIRR